MKIGKIHLTQEHTFDDMWIETLEQEGEEKGELELEDLKRPGRIEHMGNFFDEDDEGFDLAAIEARHAEMEAQVTGQKTGKPSWKQFYLPWAIPWS